jgi:hypothetical protein
LTNEVRNVQGETGHGEMVDDRYPDGIDTLWIGSDRNGHLGAFITAGLGRIPRSVLYYDPMPIFEIGDHLRELACISDVRLLITQAIADDYLELAKRGFYVYDWLDLHRAARSIKIDAYDPISAPTRPITISELPQPLADAVADVKFADIAFSDGQPVDIRSSIDWCEGVWYR